MEGNNKYFWCQNEGDYTSLPGDSGSPVFLRYDDRVVGLNWGGYDGTNKGVFSSMNFIQQELGPLTTFAIN